MKKPLLLILAVLINAVLMAQFKIEKITYFSWNAATQAYNTDTSQKYVMKFENGEYAGFDRYHTNNTKRDSYKSKVFQNGVNDLNIFGFGTEMYVLEHIEMDKVGVNWENKRKYEYVRDNDGALVEYYVYNYVSNNWVLSLGQKYETYKTGNNVDSVIRFHKTAGSQFNWFKSIKNIYEFTGSEVSRIIGMIYRQENVADTNNVYYDIDWKNFDNRITPMHNNQHIGYLNGTLNSYKVRWNEKNNQTDPDNWVDYDLNTMTYDANDRIIEQIWLDKYKYEYDYRSDGRLLSRVNSIFNGSEWQIESGTKHIDIDDNNGNYHIRHQQTYNTGVGEFRNNFLILINDAPFTSVREQEIPVAKVYPNPANEVIHIEMEKLESVEITDMTGRVLKVEITGSDNSRILNVSSLPEGIYIVKIRADGKVSTNRVVKN